MCGRFTLRLSRQVIADALQLLLLPEFEPRYNIAPTQPIAVVRPTESGRQMALLRWGLLPAGPTNPTGLINARAETIATKSTFKHALAERRCLIPADGFYEWQRAGGRKQPFFIRRPDDGLFAFAGIWQPAVGGVESCAIVTRGATPFMEPYHERMPVVLDPATWNDWLDPGLREAPALEALLACGPPELVATPVAQTVNSASAEGPACLRPVALPRTLF